MNWWNYEISPKPIIIFCINCHKWQPEIGIHCHIDLLLTYWGQMMHKCVDRLGYLTLHYLHILACHLLIVKSLSEPTLFYSRLDFWDLTSMTFSRNSTFYWKLDLKMSSAKWPCSLGIGVLNVDNYGCKQRLSNDLHMQPQLTLPRGTHDPILLDGDLRLYVNLIIADALAP